MTYPIFGALPDQTAVRVRIMTANPAASAARRVQLVLHSGDAARTYDLRHDSDGTHHAWIEGAAPGDRYGFRLDGGELRPDPASRFQPDGVHGLSEIVDPGRYRWRDAAWKGLGTRDLVVYELHIGTFTREGTFDAARRRLPVLRDLGVSAVELMPIADFAGARNWGYDGVCLFAPSRAYGRPDDLRALVDEAHALGLGVILDVVYNHIGPEAGYLTEFNPRYITGRHPTPWGGAINVDGPESAVVRRFIIDNAVHWVREYHLDGLRLDATHALIDDSPVHIVSELAREVRRAASWPVVLHAEDHRNLSAIVEPPGDGGWGLDGVWADDFHHSVRRLLAGDRHGYYGDFEGTAEELARTIRQGWLYTGQPTRRTSQGRGTDASRVPMRCSIVCLQNHDQIGNRPAGDRLHHGIDMAAWRAASAILLTAPMSPLLFMGQEWAASSPFLYFTDLEPGLGGAVTEGRRREFKDFPGFAEAAVISPQDLCAFESSKLRWEERDNQPHASVLALYRRLLGLRAAHPALQASECPRGEAWAAGHGVIVMRRSNHSDAFLIVASLSGGAEVDLSRHAHAESELEVILTTEDSAFAPDPEPPAIGSSRVMFKRAGAIVLRQLGFVEQ
jgi:maltooligosyltrehalose trehalohydrolase